MFRLKENNVRCFSHLDDPESMLETSSSYSRSSMDYPAPQESPTEVLLLRLLWPEWLECCWTDLGVYEREHKERIRE